MELIEQKYDSYLCLNMIVKNEAHIIKDTLIKLLNKVPQLDYWLISDTGSTDKTKEIILDFFKERDIKGELFDDEWKDFGHNRTKALEHAFGKSKYLLVFDADDEICGNFVLPSLTKDSYHFQFGDANGSSYTRVQIVNNNKKWKYVGVLHEIITCTEETNGMDIITGNYYTISGKSGDRSRDANKYLKDALVLEKAYVEAIQNNDGLYSRYGFYCGNSYFDCGRWEDAIKWYKITLDNNNWEQEKYMSCLRLYNCYNSLNQKETGMFYLVKAFTYDKERAECLCELVSYYCCNNLNEVAYGYYNIAKSFYDNKFLKEGLNNKLFLDVGKANLYLPYYMILVSDKMQDYDTIIQMYRIIFTKKYIDGNNFFIGNMLYNLHFFIERVKDDTHFLQLFKEYIEFLISINYPIHDHEFMDKYEKYGIILPKITEPIFSLDECKKSNKILFYTGYSPFKWNYTYSINNALGGSETAITCLTKSFSQNYEIYVAGDVEEEKVNNITYIHFNNLQNLIKNTAFHSIIISRYLNFYELYKNFSAYQTFIWGHDITLFNYGTNLSVESILTKWSSKITGCICQTEWHKQLFLSSFPQLKEKMNVINNGIVVDLFNTRERKIINRFVYTSCSERGLTKLIQLWPNILDYLPDAELLISSYNNFPKSDEDNIILEFIKKNPSVKHLGKLNRTELYKLMSTAEYWLYPSYFQETSCITSLELLASEVICLYYPVAGLVNTLGDYGIQISEGNEVDTLLNLSIKQKIELKKKGKEYALSCSWENRAKEWCNMIFSNDLLIIEVPVVENNNIIKQNSAYICGCVKNCGPFLPQVFDNIKNIISLFDSYKIVIAYDNSFDNTYNYLMEMKKLYNVEIINCNNNNTRVENICSARNSILQYIRNNDVYEYLLMIDLDNVSCEKMNTNVIKYYLNRNDWDALSFNTLYYSDIFALSIDPFIHSCWHWKDDNHKQVTDVVSIMRNYVQEKLSKIEKTDLLECLSAFNGLAIYRFEKFNNCNYGCDHAYNMEFLNKNIGTHWLNNNIDAIENKYKLRFDEKQDCEHRIFHLESIYKNNAKIRISPLSIFDFSSETNTLIKNNNYNTALIIDPRDDDNVTEVIFDFNKNLNKDFDNWKIVFYCGKNLKTKWMNIFKDINIEIRELNTNNFTSEEYSDFCKNKNLWESLYGKYVLVFQLDTIIRNEEPYTIDYFTNLNKSYIGGNMYYNWDEFTRENIHINIRNFNGGLSLRNRLDMIKIIEEFKPENTVRPSHKMATDAEDVYFTMGCYKLNLKIGDDNVSSFFAVHTIIKDKFFGCHIPNEINQELLNVYPEAIKNTHIYKKDFINNHFQNKIKEKFNNECNRISDINEHLIILYRYAKDCESIIECGVRGCVSSWAFAAGLLDNDKPNKSILLNDIDNCNIDEFLKLTQNTSLIVNYKWCSDLDLQIEKNVDMVFIDTFHVYGQLKRELEKFSKVTNKYIIMHDTSVDEIYGECIRCGLNAEIFSSKTGFSVEEINKGLGPAINEFLLLNLEWTLHKKYTNNNGLTILKKSPIITETSGNIKLEICENVESDNPFDILQEYIKKNNIKIINLKRREDRKNSMISQFERENIKSNQYKFIEAVDGNELIPTAELFSLFERNDFNYKKGVIGCALSHIHLWNELMNDTENDYYVILEDDVKLCDNFKEHLDYVCKMFVEQKLEHLALGEYLSNKDFPNEDTKIETYKKDLYKEWNSFFAYILSKSAAVKSINYINNCPIKCAIDNPQAFGYILQYSSLNTKLVHHEIDSEFGSDIQTNNIDNCLNFNNLVEPKQIVTISFCDWWQTEYCGGIFNVNNNFFTNLLSEHGDNYIIKSVSLNENPDILFYSIFGNSHKNYSAGRKIFFSGEPYGQREDADFNITFDANSCKNTRVPLWLCYFNNLLLDECIKRKNNQNTIPHRDKFCSFIATGPGLANNRQVFIEKLSKYKQVDCGGSFLNNVGYTVPLGINCSGKIEHNNKYKFAIAFESTSYPGYVTEKICDIFKSNCIPIYWGHSDVVKDFNPTTFINANNFAKFDELVDYIIKVDNNEELYKSFFKEPMLSPQWLDILTDPNKCFFKNLADNVIGKKGKKNINKLIIEEIEENNDLWIMYAFNAHNYKVLEDYIISLKQRYNIVYTQDTDYVLSCNPKKISYIMYINDDRIINKYKNTGVELSFLNTEPLSISYNLDLLKNYINKYPYLKIYDYSPSNLQIIFNNNMYAHLLEYSFYEKENLLLKELLLNEIKIYDFGIITYGNTETNTVDNSLFHKKKEVVTELIKKGFKIHIISGWGLERDIELAKCKVILNIHSVLGINDEIYYSKTFENIRCNRLLDAGFKILSEDSIHCNELISKYKTNLKFINYNDFKNIEYSENFWDKIDSNIIKKC